MNNSMTASMITLPKNFTASELICEPPKTNALGGKVVYLKYNDQKRFTMQTPLISAPFGLSTYTDEKTGITKYSIDVSFKGADADPKIKTFQEKMEEMDNHILTLAEKNSKEWLGKKMSKEVVEALYRPIIKQAKDPEKYAPTMKMKITNTTNGEMNVEAYNTKREKIDLKHELTQGSRIRCLMECSSIWFVNKQFGVSWRLVQVELHKPDKISGFSFMEDSDDDDAENEEEEYEEVTDDEGESNL
jgi:hypothetical protein